MGGVGGSTAAPAVEQAVRKSQTPGSAILSSSSSSSSSAVATGADVAPIQRPACEMDDLIMDAGKPMPRVVCPGLPSSDEAKEATVELTDALDKVHLSQPGSSESGEVAATSQFSGLSLCSNHDSETKSCLVVETQGGRLVPNPAFQALSFVSRSTEAQTVIASILSDSDVLNVAMQNPEFQDFINSNLTNADFQKHAFSENFEKSSEGTKAGTEPKAGNSENWFMNKQANIKHTIVDPVSSLASSLRNRFGFSSDVNADTKTTAVDNIKLAVVDPVSSLASSLRNIFGFSSNVNADTNTTAVDVTIGATIMGLVTFVAMVVLMKRV